MRLLLISSALLYMLSRECDWLKMKIRANASQRESRIPRKAGNQAFDSLDRSRNQLYLVEYLFRCFGGVSFLDLNAVAHHNICTLVVDRNIRVIESVALDQ